MGNMGKDLSNPTLVTCTSLSQHVFYYRLRRPELAPVAFHLQIKAPAATCIYILKKLGSQIDPKFINSFTLKIVGQLSECFTHKKKIN